MLGMHCWSSLRCVSFSQSAVTPTAGINRSNTAVRAVLEQPCSTGGRTGTVRPKHLPAGRTGLSDQFLGPVAQDQPGPVGQICPTSWLSLRSDSVRPTTGRTRLFEHRSSSRVRPVNAGSDLSSHVTHSPVYLVTGEAYVEGCFLILPLTLYLVLHCSSLIASRCTSSWVYHISPVLLGCWGIDFDLD
ncbi:hypothetical protein PCANC_14952 [Puccinia coronata f. sp. avenae]|uniref:Uncharacterized protein n=1 Tax=Puccinia coronata f. sp. avenae TaxID=200324 RepID=A0A2N5T280_9BASI|nr:hypothetical protein PCANC_14952 [Puccinia coronata f. sp. avenae]